MAVLKQIVAQYPYEDDKGQSLKTEAAALGIQLASGLQSRVSNAGVKIVAFNMTDLSYAPEIAQAMLVRQQAEAMVKVRQTHKHTPFSFSFSLLFLFVAPPKLGVPTEKKAGQGLTRMTCSHSRSGSLCLQARELIVKGAVEISQDAIQQLKSKGIVMSEGEKTKIVSNLLTVMCGEAAEIRR